MSEKQQISWDQFTADTKILAATLKEQGDIKGLIAIARGGLCATAIIANVLDIRNVKSVAVSSYDGQQQHALEMLGSVDNILDGEGWMFIDDLVDTGQTAKLIHRRYPKAKLAVVYAKPEGKENCNFFAKDMPQDTWLSFPWEV
ncbi:MAG TPA: xanthine phosphoribosyltransferase [Alphaproteobacteria bacterium]